jgi:phosphate transport system substrate-binding protein
MKHLLVLILLVGVMGCSKKPSSVTSGHRFILVADPYQNVLQAQVDQFVSIYTEAKMEVQGTSTRDAIVQLLNDSVRSIVIDRKFNEEEQQVAQQAAIRIVENRFAEDGIALIVNKQNSISKIQKEIAYKIVTREVTEWNQLPGNVWNASIDLVLTDRNSGMYELLQTKIFAAKKQLDPTAVVKDQQDIIRYVSQHPQAFGCVSASLVMGKTTDVKVLAIQVASQEGKDQDYLPGQEEIYLGLYPFHFSLYLYNAEAKAAVGVGFSAFVLSNIGQKIIQNSGLVPASIAYRTIQLTAE